MRFEMTLNYRVIVETYAFSNRVVGGLIPRYEKKIRLDWKKLAKHAKSQEPAHHKIGTKTPPCTNMILQHGKTNGLKFTSYYLTFVVYIFSCLEMKMCELWNLTSFWSNVTIYIFTLCIIYAYRVQHLLTILSSFMSVSLVISILDGASQEFCMLGQNLVISTRPA